MFWKTCLVPSIQWDPLVREAIEAPIKGISWEAQLERLHTKGQWTIVLGDCWPRNLMWVTSNCQGDDEKVDSAIKLLDREMVGLGSGPQDLGQYMLSNMDPIESLA